MLNPTLDAAALSPTVNQPSRRMMRMEKMKMTKKKREERKSPMLPPAKDGMCMANTTIKHFF
jgi:hypothetical protein